MLNAFRIIGDTFHVAAMSFVTHGLLTCTSAANISVRSLELYALVYVTRYSDLFQHGFFPYNSLYTSILKIVFIILSITAIIVLRHRHKIDPRDSLWAYLLVIPAAMCVFVFPTDHGEWLWAFSIYLETIALLPQAMLFISERGAERWVAIYVTLMGLFRVFYCANWVYRYNHEHWYRSLADNGHDLLTTWVCGMTQTLIFCLTILFIGIRRFAVLPRMWLPARAPSFQGRDPNYCSLSSLGYVNSLFSGDDFLEQDCEMSVLRENGNVLVMRSPIVSGMGAAGSRTTTNDETTRNIAADGVEAGDTILMKTVDKQCT